MTTRNWLITGVSGGLGRAMAEILLERGDRVAGTVRQPDAVEELQRRYGEQLRVFTLDVTDGPGVATVVDAAFAALGRVDAIVNNAGYGLFGAAEELTDEQVVHQLDTNLLGSIRVVRAALPRLRAQGGGHLLQISSYGGQATNPGASLYHASKWGIEGFMESTARDVAPFGIAVTIVEPGSVGTGFRTSGALLAKPLAAYDGTPAAMTRRIQDPALPSVGDVRRTASAIVGAVDEEPAPRRLVLGSDSYQYMHAALSERLQELESRKEQAPATDAAGRS